MSGFNKIINLVEKTKEKFVILDKNGNPSCVIMPISEYESLAIDNTKDEGLTEDDILDTINGDIEDIKDESEHSVDSVEINDNSPKSSFGAQYFQSIKSEENEDNSDVEEDDDRYYFEPIE